MNYLLMMLCMNNFKTMTLNFHLKTLRICDSFQRDELTYEISSSFNFTSITLIIEKLKSFTKHTINEINTVNGSPMSFES